MKILFIQKVKGLAGSEKYFLDILPALQKEGLICEFLCVRERGDGDKPDVFINKLKKHGIVVHDFEVSSAFHPKILFYIKKLVKKNNYDLVHTHLIHADFWGALSQRFLNVKMIQVSTKHGYEESFINVFGFEGEFLKKNTYYRICKWSEKYIQKSFAVSDGLKNLFIQSSISSPDKIKTIHHGFNYPIKDKVLSSEFRYTSKQLVILGRLVGFKGHRFLLDSLPYVVKSIPDVHLLIVGSGVEEGKLRKQVAELGLLSNVSFLGFKQNISDYLDNSDVMVVPSVAEGFGLVLLEGFNSNLPVVAFDVPACNEIIDHELNGILVKPYDIKLLSESLIRLLNDKEICESMGEEGKKKLQSYFTLERMTKETLSFYKIALRDSLKLE